MEHCAAICHFFVCLFVKLGDSATTTHGKLQQAFGDDAMSRAQAFRWHKMFSESRTLIEDEQRSGRPSTTQTSDNTARVRELVWSDRRLTVNTIADEVNLNQEAVYRILTEELGMRKVCQDGAQESDRATARCVGERLCWTAGTSGSRPRVNGVSYHWWRELVFPIWSRDQTPKFGMVCEGITKAKETTHVQVKIEMHACVLLWFHGYCSQRVGSCWTDSQSVLLQRHSWKTQESHAGSSKHCQKLDPSSQHCASPCSALCSAVFGIQMHYSDAAASLLTWSGALRLFFVSKSKIASERTPFWVNRRHPEVCNEGLKWHTTSCVPGMLQRMAAPLEKVCAGTRDVLWRWPHCSWWINKIKLFLEPVSLLYCRTT